MTAKTKGWLFVLASAAALAAFLFALPTPDGAKPDTVAAAALPSAAAGDGGVLVFHDVRLFDGERLHTSTTVVVADGVVRAVGPDADVPAGAAVIEGAGKTLLPGLIDAHTHNYGNALERALVFGVTTHLDQFTDWRQAARWRAEQAAGEAASRADIFSAGTLVTKAGGHGTQFGLDIPTLADATAADSFVADRLAEGSDWIKLVIEDGSEIGRSLPTLDAKEAAAVVAAAHRRGVLAVAHVHTRAAALLAVAAGVDGLAHLFVDEPPGAGFGALLAEHGTFVIPTLSVLASLAGEPAGASLVDDGRLSSYLLASERNSARQSFGKLAPRAISVAAETLAQLRAAGVPILAGSDAPNPGTAYGASLHGELELLVANGLTPLEALHAATAAPADAFRLPDRGRIAPGMRADLLLVDGDPTRDITATRAIAGIWKAGHAFDRRPPDPATPQQAVLPPGVLRVSDFDDGEMNAALGAGWSASTDSLFGGHSTVELTVGDKALAVSGEIARGFAFPWAGAMLAPGAAPMSPVDLGDGTVLVFRTRGDALDVLVFAEALGPRPVTAEIDASPDWQEHRIELASLGLDGRAVQGFLFTGAARPGRFRFELDDVALERPADEDS